MARRPDYKPRSRTPAHRVQQTTSWPSVRARAFGELVVSTEHCRCGAWRSLVWLRLGEVGERAPLVSDWSAPCSAPSPAPAQDDA